MTKGNWLIYGAYGFSGTLIAREAVSRGLRPVVAGRDERKTADLANDLKLDHRTADPDSIGSILAGIGTVLNCAGPFSRTWKPVTDACIEHQANYLDITGEVDVFEQILARNGEARRAGVTLIPGVGFDVVPTDCLAAKLAERLPDATELDLAFYQRGGGISRGTLKTVIEGLGKSGAVRRDGTIEGVPVAWKSKEIPFSCGSRTAMTIPWGDVSTAWHTTRIPNITVYQGIAPKRLRTLRRLRPLLPLASLPPLRNLLRLWADRHEGPDRETRRDATMYVWGEARRGDESVSMTLETPEAYEVTATLAVRAVERVVAGEVEPGASTPSIAFGADFIDGIEGVTIRE